MNARFSFIAPNNFTQSANNNRSAKIALSFESLCVWCVRIEFECVNINWNRVYRPKIIIIIIAINEPHKFISLIEFYMENVCYLLCAWCQHIADIFTLYSIDRSIDRSMNRLPASECDISIWKSLQLVCGKTKIYVSPRPKKETFSCQSNSNFKCVCVCAFML